jgi:hypothetical protein
MTGLHLVLRYRPMREAMEQETGNTPGVNTRVMLGLHGPEWLGRLFRLSIYVPDFDMQFNYILVRDEEPLLFHAGLKGRHIPGVARGDGEDHRPGEAPSHCLEPLRVRRNRRAQ